MFCAVLRTPLLKAFLFIFATAFFAIGRLLKFDTLQNAYQASFKSAEARKTAFL